MKADGTQAHRVAYGGDPSWSPDSRQIAFTRLEFNVVRLWAIDLTTSRLRELTQ